MKGVHYSLPYFLGLRVPKGQMLHGAMQDTSDLLMNKDGSTKLYQAVVYLSPGDYHRFHSPVEWTIHTRRYYISVISSMLINNIFIQKCQYYYTLSDQSVPQVTVTSVVSLLTISFVIPLYVRLYLHNNLKIMVT